MIRKTKVLEQYKGKDGSKTAHRNRKNGEQK